jgi:hypothetical protein
MSGGEVPTYADGIEAAARLAALYDTGSQASAALMVSADIARQVASPTPEPSEADRGTGEREACCEHSLSWHHERRGCGYHGFAPGDRCPCLLTFDEALASHDAATADRMRRETAEGIAAAITDAVGATPYAPFSNHWTGMHHAARIAREAGTR